MAGSGVNTNTARITREQEERSRRQAAAQIPLLERAVADRGNHQHRHQEDEERGRDRQRLVRQGLGVHEHHQGERSRAGRDREADEEAPVAQAGLHVEASQADRACDEEEERGRPPPPPRLVEPPLVDEDRGGDAEAHDVGEGVVLPTELRGGAR